MSKGTRTDGRTRKHVTAMAGYAEYFHCDRKVLRYMPMEQLNACADDAARRILLGISGADTLIFAQCRKGDHKHCFVLRCQCECHKHA